MSEFKPLEPRNLGYVVDVIPKGAQQESVDMVEAYIKELEKKIAWAIDALKHNAPDRALVFLESTRTRK